MAFEHKDQEFFQTNPQGEIMVQLHYTLLPQKQAISIDQIFVQPQYRNQGLAGKILLAALDWVQQQNLTVVPVCPFARQFFQREPKFQSLLAINSDKGDNTDESR